MLFAGGEIELESVLGCWGLRFIYIGVERVGGVGVMLRKELCEKVVEVRRVSDRIMAVV